MAEYIKVINSTQVIAGAEYTAGQLGNSGSLVGTTSSPILKPYFKTEIFDTKSAREVFVKYTITDAESYTWNVNSGSGTQPVTSVTSAVDEKFQISVYTYLGDEWFQVYSRGNISIGTYVLKYRNDDQNVVYSGSYNDFRGKDPLEMIIGSKTYIQVEPTAVATFPWNPELLWDWIDGGDLEQGDTLSSSGFIDVGSFSVWLNNKEEF